MPELLMYSEACSFAFSSEYKWRPKSRHPQEKLTSELGVIVRSFAPLEHKSWTKIPLHDIETLMERVKAKFWIDMTVPYVWDFVHNSMGKKYNSYRSTMNSYFADVMKDHPIERVKYMSLEGVTKDKWAWLCNHFNSGEFKKKSLAGSNNRKKVKYNHCSGSMSFVARHEMEKMIALQIQGKEEGVEPRDEAEICAEVLGRKKKEKTLS
ncbi:hypothetical protein MKW94_007059 [Papaver nudicaule]|uniref:Transposase n=1 Tax=Papaver nudicaule TaxID=74823 RepID=A0AA41W200_PAPNU|nr:hypothetical protein [Papaver nudicaule]